MRKYIILTILLNSMSCLAQDSTLKIYLKNLIEIKKNENNYIQSSNFYSRVYKVDTSLFSLLTHYEKDSNFYVRYFIFNTYRNILLNTKDIDFKKYLNKKLLNVTTDSLKYNENKTLSNQSICEGVLNQYDMFVSKELFDKEDKDFLVTAINKKIESESKLILLAGWLDLKEVIPHLKWLLKNGKNKDDYEYYILLALSRMGEKEYTQKAIDRIIDKDLNKHSILSLLQDKDFLYLKQPEVIEFYISQLDSKEEIKGFFMNSDSPNYPVACYAVGYLREKIKSFNDFILIDHFDKNNYESLLKEYNNISKYDRDIQKPSKIPECSYNTYIASKKWFYQNKGKYNVDFDKNKYY